MEPDTLAPELAALLNRHSRENASNTPDFILAEYMLTCLAAFEHASRKRETWFGRFLTPSGPVTGGEFGGEKVTFNPDAPMTTPPVDTSAWENAKRNMSEP